MRFKRTITQSFLHRIAFQPNRPPCQQLAIFTSLFPAFRRLRRADLVYVYHYTLAVKPDCLRSNAAHKIPDAHPDKYMALTQNFELQTSRPAARK